MSMKVSDGGSAAAVGLDEPVTVAGLPCGHLPGEWHDTACDYWLGVLAGEFPPPEAYADAAAVAVGGVR